MIKEYARVLAYRKFRLTAEEIAALFEEEFFPFFSIIPTVSKKVPYPPDATIIGNNRSLFKFVNIDHLNVTHPKTATGPRGARRAGAAPHVISSMAIIST